jgi:hypothetical protein
MERGIGDFLEDRRPRRDWREYRIRSAAVAGCAMNHTGARER